MILTFTKAKHVEGSFCEYAYKTLIQRTPASENFGCFKGNDIKVVTIVQLVYCHNNTDFDKVIREWSNMAVGLLSMYSYQGLGKTNLNLYTATEVLERMYNRDNRHLANLIYNSSTEIIQ